MRGNQSTDCFTTVITAASPGEKKSRRRGFKPTSTVRWDIKYAIKNTCGYQEPKQQTSILPQIHVVRAQRMSSALEKMDVFAFEH